MNFFISLSCDFPLDNLDLTSPIENDLMQIFRLIENYRTIKDELKVKIDLEIIE